MNGLDLAPGWRRGDAAERPADLGINRVVVYEGRSAARAQADFWQDTSIARSVRRPPGDDRREGGARHIDLARRDVHFGQEDGSGGGLAYRK